MLPRRAKQSVPRHVKQKTSITKSALHVLESIAWHIRLGLRSSSFVFVGLARSKANEALRKSLDVNTGMNYVVVMVACVVVCVCWVVQSSNGRVIMQTLVYCPIKYK